MHPPGERHAAATTSPTGSASHILPSQPRKSTRVSRRTVKGPPDLWEGRHGEHCDHSGVWPLNEPAYAYLLGLYLGDGHIGHYRGHRAPNLMITCSDAWPGLMDECERAMQSVLPGNSVCRVRRQGCHNVKIYSHHLLCLFPQHGPGKKHERPIFLANWQKRVVERHPWGLIRGLIHSDGCRVTNWATRVVGGVRKRYEYPRYFFTNKSEDILGIYSSALDLVHVEWRVTRRGQQPYNVSVARRGSVALLDRHVGPKH